MIFIELVNVEKDDGFMLYRTKQGKIEALFREETGSTLPPRPTFIFQYGHYS